MHCRRPIPVTCRILAARRPLPELLRCRASACHVADTFVYRRRSIESTLVEVSGLSVRQQAAGFGQAPDP